MKDIGIGTERIEAEIRELFPEAKVFRMDKDTVSRKNSHSEILSSFKHTKGAILIGTQMIGKGLDFPMVSLVGVINAKLKVLKLPMPVQQLLILEMKRFRSTKSLKISW